MQQFLIHVTCGPENPSKAALAFLVARAALEEGHGVTMFLAADSVQLLRPEVIDGLMGLGTGKLSEHLRVLKDKGVKLYASGLSATSRGLKPTDIDETQVSLAPPTVLVRLAAEADKVLCY